MKCHAVGCERQIPEHKEAVLCQSCLVEMDRILREEVAKRIGRRPTDREMDEMMEKFMATRPN